MAVHQGQQTLCPGLGFIGPVGGRGGEGKPLVTAVPSLLSARPQSGRGAVPHPVRCVFQTCAGLPCVFPSSCFETGSDSPKVGNNWILNSNSSVKYSVIKLA